MDDTTYHNVRVDVNDENEIVLSESIAFFNKNGMIRCIQHDMEFNVSIARQIRDNLDKAIEYVEDMMRE